MEQAAKAEKQKQERRASTMARFSVTGAIQVSRTPNASELQNIGEMGD